MNLFSALVVLAQLAMLGNLVQATLSPDNLVQYSTRELVEELQTRMVISKRTASDPYSAPATHYGPIRRSLDDSLELTSRAKPGTTANTGGESFGTDLTSVSTGSTDVFAAYRPTVMGRVKGAIKGAAKSVGGAIFKAIIPDLSGSPMNLS